MTTISKILNVQQVDGSITDCKVTFDETKSSKIDLTLINGSTQSFEGGDLSKSLTLVRKYFETNDAKLLCNGARKDVYPSNMSRSMGRGRKAYILKIGKQALLEDLVDIFEPAKPDDVGTVKEQVNYYKQWIDSLGK